MAFLQFEHRAQDFISTGAGPLLRWARSARSRFAQRRRRGGRACPQFAHECCCFFRPRADPGQRHFKPLSAAPSLICLLIESTRFSVAAHGVRLGAMTIKGANWDGLSDQEGARRAPLRRPRTDAEPETYRAKLEHIRS